MLRLPGEVRWSITESDRPRGEALRRLEQRVALLRSFPPCPPDKARVMISRLFLRFPGMAKASEEQVSAYAQDLRPYPLWAVVEGIARIIDGCVLKNLEFPPTSLQVREAVAQAAGPVLEEIAAIDGLLGATVIPDEAARPALDRRKELAEMIRGAMREGAPERPPPRPRDTRIVSSFDAAHEARDPAPPVVASEALMQTLNRGSGAP